MDEFAEFLGRIANPQHRARMTEVFDWIAKTYPSLEPKLAWNQPMFTDHGTFIIGFSAAKKHMSVAPERAGMVHCAEYIEGAGYDHSKELVRFAWDRPMDYALLAKMIEFNISDKADCKTFWR